MNGLYKESGSPHVFHVENGTKRWIKDPAQGFAEFGPDFWSQVQEAPAGSLNALSWSGDIFGVPWSGGGTFTIGNQRIPGNVWLWVVAALVVVFFLSRK